MHHHPLFIIEVSDHILFVQNTKKSLRRKISFYFEHLLSYLTPSEAAIALAAYLSEAYPNREIAMQVYTMLEQDTIQLISWNKQIQSVQEEAIPWCKAHLPVIKQIPIQETAHHYMNNYIHLSNMKLRRCKYCL